MRSWQAPALPRLEGRGGVPRIYDESTESVREIAVRDGVATIYTCGITPYDATHLGHAATFLAVDTLTRVLLDAGVEVRSAMNSTDVDDPLLERASRDGVDWRELADREQERFRGDMAALRILPPDAWIAVTERVPEIAAAVQRLLDSGAAYRLDGDVLFDTTQRYGAELGQRSHTDRESMLALAAEFGGEIDREGKRDELDPVLWRGPRVGEPSWETVLGGGRPGWHIECTVIAAEELTTPISVIAGGRDLRFPHRELQDQHALALGRGELSSMRLGAGLVALDGEKMSKSLGNLVFVDALRRAHRPAAIRLALLSHHWRDDWQWTAELLSQAEARLDAWQQWASREHGDPSLDGDLAPWLRLTLANDLDTPAAIAAVDAAIARGEPATKASLDAIDALLGIRLGEQD